MTDVNRFRDGELSSTALMQDAMERAHAVAQGEGQKLEWHKDHESMDQARARMHEEPEKAAEAALEWMSKRMVYGEAGLIGPKLIHSLTPQLEAAAKTYAALRTAALMPFAEAAAGVVLIAAAVVEGPHAMAQGDELTNRANVDAMDVAVTELLDLDHGFKTQEWKKFPGITPNSTTALFVDSYGKPTEFGTVHLPELQAAADAGANAAIAAMRMGGKEAYFSQNSLAERRFQNDVAFSRGFDNVMFIVAHAGADEKMRALEARMADRNVRGAVSVQVKG